MKILGITLVKNEDLYIRQALLNSLDFCDEIIVLDNNSTDNTWGIVSKLSKEYSHVSARRWVDPMNSGIAINPYIGKDYWVFGIDGDEIYDPLGLSLLRKDLLNGIYKNIYCIKGHCLHCSDINLSTKKAEGWDCPPSRTITKLYNFSLLKNFKQNERLHGYSELKNGYDSTPFNLCDTMSWDDSHLKCLHAAFVPRSSLDLSPSPRTPPNGNLPFKLEKYRKGEIIKRNISTFL